MKRIIFFLFLTFFFSFIYAQEFNVYKSATYAINFKYPLNWNVEEKPAAKKIVLTDMEDTVSVNIAIFQFSEPITANALQIKRMGALYDGWINLGERVGSNEERVRANVDDKYVAIYKKRLVDESLNYHNVLAGEYYYTKDNRGYVITINTNMEKWSSIQKDIKLIVDGFWVGTGRRSAQTFFNPALFRGWGMIGRNAANHNNLKINLSLRNHMSIIWEFMPKKINSDGLKHNSLVYDEKSLYFSLGRYIYSIGIKDGQLNWKYQTPANIKKMISLNNDILYFILGDGRGELYAILTNNGNILFKIPIGDTDSCTPPVFLQNNFYLLDQGKLISYVSDTGAKNWEKDLQLTTKSHPVISENTILVTNQNNDLLAVDALTGDLIWQQKHWDSISCSPIIYEKNIFLLVQRGDRHGVLALNLLDGNTVWENMGLPAGYFFSQSAALSEKTLVTFLKPDSKTASVDDLIVSLDTVTGKTLWDYKVPRDVESDFFQPKVGLDQISFYKTLNIGYKTLIYYMTLEALTGKPSHELILELFNGNVIIDITQHYFLENGVLLALQDKENKKIKYLFLE